MQSIIIFIEPGRATYVARAGEVLEVKMSRMRDNLSEDRGAATVNVHKNVHFSWINTSYCGSVPTIVNPILKVSRCLWLTMSIWALEE